MMFKPMRVKLSLVLLSAGIMLGAVVASEWAKPTRHWSDAVGTPKYADIIPASFGDWQMLEIPARAVVNPVQEERLMELYTETVARAYVHKPTGRLLMLSVAYGKDQSTDTQIHTPDACYPSQGFRVESRAHHDLQVAGRTVPTVRLMTTMGAQRTEPLTYFIRVGDGLARGSKERNLARLSMAVRGYLVDGMLFRVSEVTKSTDAFDLQDRFIQDLLAQVPGDVKRHIIGSAPHGA